MCEDEKPKTGPTWEELAQMRGSRTFFFGGKAYELSVYFEGFLVQKETEEPAVGWEDGERNDVT